MNLIKLFQRGSHTADTPADTAQETALQEAMQSAYSTGAATPALRRRVADMALQHAQQQVMMSGHRTFSLRRCLLQTASIAACVFVALAVVAWPNIKTAYLLYRMQSAIVHAHTLDVYIRHSFKTKTTIRGKTPDMTVATSWVRVQGGKWHIESTIDPNAFFDGSHINFSDNLTAHHVTVKDTTMPPTQYQWVGGISLTASASNTAAVGLFSRLYEQREEWVNGRKMIVYIWTLPHIYPRTWIWLDANSCAPVQIEVEEEHSGVSVWRSYTMTRFGLDGPLQTGL